MGNLDGAGSEWGGGGGSSDKLPSLPVSLAPLSSLCSRRSSSGEEGGEGLFYQVEVILSSVRLFGGEEVGEVVEGEVRGEGGEEQKGEVEGGGGGGDEEELEGEEVLEKEGEV